MGLCSAASVFNCIMYCQELANVIPRDTLLWKLKLLKSAAAYANSRLHAVKAEVLVLARFLLSLEFTPHIIILRCIVLFFISQTFF